VATLRTLLRALRANADFAAIVLACATLSTAVTVSVMQWRRAQAATNSASRLQAELDAARAQHDADARASRQARDAAGRYAKDLDDELERLDVDGVARNRLVYGVGAIGERLLPDPDLLRLALDSRAGAVASRGDEALVRGDVAAAKRAFVEAEAILRDLGEARPDDAELSSHLAACWVRRAEIDLRSGDDAHARRLLEFAEAVLQRAAIRRPTDPDVAGAEADADERLAMLAGRHGEKMNARAFLDKAAKALQRASDAGTAGRFGLRLPDVYLHLSDAFRDAGQLDAAAHFMDQGMAEVKHLTALMPDDATYRNELAVFYGRRASLIPPMELLINPSRARALYDDAISISEALVKAEPKNSVFRHDLALHHGKLGLVDAQAGDLRGARPHFERCVELRRALRADADLAQADLPIELATCEIYLAIVLERTNEHKDARDLATHVRADLAALRGERSSAEQQAAIDQMLATLATSVASPR
jgi:tetratricopeptide (TPR) repeat protein